MANKTLSVLQKIGDVIAVGSLPVIMFYFSVVKLHKKEVLPTLAPLYPYHTIDMGNQELLGYVLNKEEDKSVPYAAYTAVIKGINPAKDDYKTCCKAVISDVVKSVDSDEIAVTVFDSFEASQLFEAYEQRFQILTQQQMNFINKHTVAVYYGSVGDFYAQNHRVSFYETANNGHYESEPYVPVVL